MVSVASLLNDETVSNFPDKFALDVKKKVMKIVLPCRQI